MLFALVIALSSSIVAVSAVSRSSAERAADFKDSTTKLVNKNIHALAEAGMLIALNHSFALDCR